MNNTMMLPKLWLEAIQCIWEKRVPNPSSYPSTKTEFSLEFDSKEIRAAVIDMEKKLNSTESIIKPDMIPENKLLNNYLGTYNVKGEPNEKVLISPEKVPEGTVGAIVMHYNETTDTWVKVDTAEVIDEFVYATMTDFSPIAVFTLGRDTVYFESFGSEPKPVYFANGIPVVITENGEDATKVNITDANGKVTVTPKDIRVFGGTYDSSEVKTTSVCVKGVTNLFSVTGGSYGSETPMNIDKIKVDIIDSKITNAVNGAFFYNRAKEVEINMTNSSSYFVSCGQSYIPLAGKDSNTENPNYGSNTWVKNAKLNLTNCDITLVYGAGNSGCLYTDTTEVNIDGGELDYVLACGSNGRTDNATVVAKNCKMQVTQTTNRGTVGSAKMVLKDCEVTVAAIAGDPTDNTVTGTVKNIKYDITGGKAKVYAGTNGGVALDVETANEIIEYVKISRSTDVEYFENTKNIIEDKLRIK